MVYMYGGFTQFGMQLYLGKRNEGGQLLATAERVLTMGEFFGGSQTYVLNVQPGVDGAFCVLMCLAFDEFYNDN